MYMYMYMYVYIYIYIYIYNIVFNMTSRARRVGRCREPTFTTIRRGPVLFCSVLLYSIPLYFTTFYFAIISYFILY